MHEAFWHITQAFCGAAHQPCIVCRCMKCAAPYRHRGMSDVDAVYYLNRTAVPVIGAESLSTQLSEFSKPPHHQKIATCRYVIVQRRTGTRCADHNACKLRCNVSNHRFP